METYEKIVESSAAQLIFETELEDTTDKFPARSSLINSGLTIDPRIDSNLFDDNGKEITVDCPEIACDPTVRGFSPSDFQRQTYAQHASRLELILDSESSSLDRKGIMRLLQLKIRSQKHIYIFDIHKLGGKSIFDRKGKERQSLRKLLESKEHIQLWWDSRQDQDALFGLFGIRLGRVMDVQLMEIASPTSNSSDRIIGLASAVKALGQEWTSSESDYVVFDTPDLPDLALEYSAGDVESIKKLYDVYRKEITKKGWLLVHYHSRIRLRESMYPWGAPKATAYIISARSAVPEAFQYISHRSGARHSMGFWDNLFRDRSIDAVIKLAEEKAADPWGIVGWKDEGDWRYTKAVEGWRGSLKKSRSDLAITTWGESDNQTARRCKRYLKDIGSVLGFCGWNKSITNVSEWSLQEPEYSPELDYVDFGADIREDLQEALAEADMEIECCDRGIY
ncbi:hypothetical protein WAI453_004463 [Rhynchosporium graminicola]